MLWVLLALLLSTVPALAQGPASYTLTLTEAQLNLVGRALSKQPYEDVYQILAVIQQQVNQQQAAAKPPPPAQSEPPK
jgi:hypothetical protein